MLQNKKILLGVTGSIAAYKSALLIRLLVKQGAEVKVIMTDSAQDFITPLTLATLSKNPVLSEFIQDKTGVWNNHVELGLWADAFIIAPVSANTIAKCANAFCDNLLTATYLSARCPIFFAPAMDLDMYRHPGTLQNLYKLKSYGNHIIPAEHGELASGLIGDGRMAEPEHIISFLQKYFSSKSLTQVFSTPINVLITSGPTKEAIDPVRFISNHSTGKMGYAIAEAFANQGANVFLVSGPTNLSVTHPSINKIDVMSAKDMFEASKAYFSEAQITILAAAVADYTPLHPSEQKIKKKEGEESMTLQLTKTTDIAKYLGEHKKPNQLLIGFALETENELENAMSKLQKKKLDGIILNSLNDSGAGFGHDTNKITLISKSGDTQYFPLSSKKELADIITSWSISAFNELKNL
jgi:phosphopantothenoylcysteine decarboxylase / phosphopantothenate---cysteine ligase